MAVRGPRKTAPGVRDGGVVKQNRHERTPNYWNTAQAIPAIDRERPGPGCRHALRKEDVAKFVGLLPEWEELSRGLDAILLARGGAEHDGWYDVGVVGICAWDRGWTKVWSREAVQDHAGLLRQLGVPTAPERDEVAVLFTEETVRAYQLTHVLLHELGHHHDRMSTRSARASARGEGFAEAYALKHWALVWRRYCEAFGEPR